MSLAAAGLAALAVLLWPVGRDMGAQQRGIAGGHLVSGPSLRAGWAAACDRGRAGFPWSAEGARALRRAAQLDTTAVLALVETLAPALEAGLTPAAALASSVEATAGGASADHTADHGLRAGGGLRLVATPSTLDDVVTHARQGSAMGPVWQAAAGASGSSDLQLLGAAWALSESSGAPLADAVRTVARVLRAALAHERQVQGAVAGARATMNLLSALPLGGPLVALALGIGPRDLYAGPAAGISLVAGVMLAMGGRWWVRRLVAAVARGPAVL